MTGSSFYIEVAAGLEGWAELVPLRKSSIVCSSQLLYLVSSYNPIYLVLYYAIAILTTNRYVSQLYLTVLTL